MMYHDFVDQTMSYDARRYAMVHERSNVPWPKPTYQELTKTGSTITTGKDATETCGYFVCLVL